MKINRKKLESAVEQRLRAEASAWAEQVRQPVKNRVQLHDRNPTMGRSRSSGAWKQWSVLSAAVVLIGLVWWNLTPSTGNTDAIVALRPIASASAEDLATLRATNHAIRKVFGSAAQSTRTAVGRRMEEVNQIALTSDSLKLADASGDSVRRWAREPGRQYLAAAQWLDGRLGLLGDSSLSAAKRLLGKEDRPAASASDG